MVMRAIYGQYLLFSQLTNMYLTLWGLFSLPELQSMVCICPTGASSRSAWSKDCSERNVTSEGTLLSSFSICWSSSSSSLTSSYSITPFWFSSYDGSGTLRAGALSSIIRPRRLLRSYRDLSILLRRTSLKLSFLYLGTSFFSSSMYNWYEIALFEANIFSCSLFCSSDLTSIIYFYVCLKILNSFYRSLMSLFSVGVISQEDINQVFSIEPGMDVELWSSAAWFSFFSSSSTANSLRLWLWSLPAYSGITFYCEFYF